METRKGSVADFAFRRLREGVKAIGWVTGLGDMDAAGITTKVAFLIEDADNPDDVMVDANIVMANLRGLGFRVVGFSSRLGIPTRFAMDRLYIFDRDSAKPFYLPDVVLVDGKGGRRGKS